MKTLWACVLISCVSFLVYAPVFGGWWLADDFGYAGINAGKPFCYWTSIIATDWTRGIWGHQLDEMRCMLALAF